MQICGIIGAGQIGSRHLQALAAMPTPLKVYVCDPSADSLRQCQQRLEETPGWRTHIQAEFVDAPSRLPAHLDLAIVATNSKHRWDALQRLLDQSEVKFLLLEKFLFPSPDPYRWAAELLGPQQSTTWVNCNRRVWPVYRELQRELAGRKIHYRVSGSQWGLACNSIHFIDQLAFFTGQQNYALDDVQLTLVDQQKRPGFIDFVGSLRGTTSRGDRFEITSEPQPGRPLEISIQADDIEFYINETEHTGWTVKRASQGTRVDREFINPYVSETTQIICQDILTHGRCDLPQYRESAALHLPLLEAFLQAYQHETQEEADLCPIT